MRPLQDWEVGVFLDFMELLHRAEVKREESDSSRWQLSGDGKFSVRSFFRSFKGNHSGNFPWKKIWKYKMPPRVSFLVWTASWGKVLTLDNLRRRGFCLAGRCFMCKCDDETVEHLFVHCEVARALWLGVLGYVCVSWVLPRKVEDVLRSWHRKLRDKDSQLLWGLIPSCIFWCVWEERNGRCFQDTENPLVKLKEKMFTYLFFWFNAVAEEPVISIHELLRKLGSLY